MKFHDHHYTRMQPLVYLHHLYFSLLCILTYSLSYTDASDKGCKDLYSTPQRLPPFDPLNMEIREVRVGPKCSAVITASKDSNKIECFGKIVKKNPSNASYANRGLLE